MFIKIVSKILIVALVAAIPISLGNANVGEKPSYASPEENKPAVAVAEIVSEDRATSTKTAQKRKLQNEDIVSTPVKEKCAETSDKLACEESATESACVEISAEPVAESVAESAVAKLEQRATNTVKSDSEEVTVLRQEKNNAQISIGDETSETSENSEIKETGVQKVQKFALTKESTDLIPENTWIFVESMIPSGDYEIKWYDESIIIPFEVVGDSFSSELPEDPSCLRTAGIITRAESDTIEEIEVQPQQLNPNEMNQEYRGRYGLITKEIKVSGFKLEPGTLIQIWGKDDSDDLIVCWYEKYIIVPADVVEVCESLPDWAEKKSAGIQLDPLKMPAKDIHCTDAEKIKTQYAVVAENATIYCNQLPRKEEIISQGTIIQIFCLDENEKMYVMKYGENDIAHIFKDNVNIIEKEKLSEEQLVSGKFEGIITKKP